MAKTRKEIQDAYDAKRQGKRNSYKSCKVLQSKYGITLDNYQQMLIEQNNSCRICGTLTADKSNISRRFAVDHCHTTGKVRGLLCIKCNAGIGMFNDNLDILISAVSYLQEHR